MVLKPWLLALPNVPAENVSLNAGAVTFGLASEDHWLTLLELSDHSLLQSLEGAALLTGAGLKPRDNEESVVDVASFAKGLGSFCSSPKFNPESESDKLGTFARLAT